ncbi:MAG: hypothetical protein KatS3mg015_2631 [Fimbriimonadales bacterium]|nr:MAG: hypothetical protein KatS3mg015_2631 [Fimbriimonadales bacterium]
MHEDGPFIVSELLRAAALDWKSLPAKVVALYDTGRLIFQNSAMLVVTASGDTIVMSPEDILLFRGDEPYAVIHLH